MALDLLELAELHPSPATIVGDNLGVVRYRADTGQLRSYEKHNILDAALGRAACKRKLITW
eukprot:11161767-Lingulodinium_polyedra.AAC.1